MSEIGRRSRRELGFSGLAQREGFRAPEALIRRETGSTARAASALVLAGTKARDSATTGASASAERWFREVGAAVAAGSLSVDAAREIRIGLGPPSESAGAATPDDLASAGGVRSAPVRRTRRPNGLSRYIIDPDIESAASRDGVYDTLTSPRRGGVRFVDDADRAWAEAISTDERTTDQYVHDSFTQLLWIPVSSEAGESRRIVGSRQPSVRVLVTKTALDRVHGHGRIEGWDIPIALETVDRIACECGMLELDFDESGRPLDLGQEQRLYAKRQRIALAVAQGGCMFGNCDRPPS